MALMLSPARIAKHVPVAALMPMIRTRAAVKKVRLVGAGCVERCSDTCCKHAFTLTPQSMSKMCCAKSVNYFQMPVMTDAVPSPDSL